MQTNPYLAAARSGRNDIWRYVVTILLSLGLLIVGTTFLSLAVFIFTGSPDLNALSPAAQMVVLLSPFSLLIAGLWLGLRFLHHRPFRSLLRPVGRFRWRSLLLSAGLWLGLSAAGDFIVHQLRPNMYQFSYDPT
ncbi:MAG: hypothetical protein EHM21_05910, partial [Chloroflexi bacterium]